MARNVFDDDTPGPSRKHTESVRKRKTVLHTIGGPASGKYIDPSTQGALDRYVDEIDIAQIAPSPIKDRIDLNVDIESLAESIKANGQQVPIIVRRLESQNPSYQVVVGRRRIAALQRLGREKVRAFIRDMSEEEAFRVQGLENIQRLDTSFIERAMVAQHSIERNYSLDDISGFLSLSKSHVSNLASIYKQIGDELAQALGPAHKIGRRRWKWLSDTITELDIRHSDVVKLIDRRIEDSSERFESLAQVLQAKLDVLTRQTVSNEPSSDQNHVATDQINDLDLRDPGIDDDPLEHAIDDDDSSNLPANYAPTINTTTNVTPTRVRKFLGGSIRTSVNDNRIIVNASSDAPKDILEEVLDAIEGVLRKHKDGGA